jgi:hypothetical protein
MLVLIVRDIVKRDEYHSLKKISSMPKQKFGPRHGGLLVGKNSTVPYSSKKAFPTQTRTTNLPNMVDKLNRCCYNMDDEK